MKKIVAILAIWVCFSFQLHAQIIQPGYEGQIGIFENLGKPIPLDLKFINEKNDTVSLRQLIDRPTILSFVYFDCPGICTPLLEGVSEVIEQMDMEIGKDYKVISISFNTNDDPAKAVSKKGDVVCENCIEKNANWTYLTGDSASINSVLTSVGFSIKRVGNDYLHPGAIIVVSPQGVITRYLYGIKFMPLDLKLALIEAQKGLSRPTVHRVLEFCYSYDPVGKRYGLEITKLMGTFILFIIVTLLAFLFIKSKKRTQKAKNE
jgi:protein SCO1/2